MIFAAVTISTDGVFVASTGQVLGLYVGLTVALGFLNSLPTKSLHQITSIYGTRFPSSAPIASAEYYPVFFNLLTSIAIIIAIPAGGAGNLASHKFVWTSVSYLIILKPALEHLLICLQRLLITPVGTTRVSPSFSVCLVCNG